MMLSPGRGEATGLALAAAGTLLSALSDHVLADFVGGFLILVGGMGLYLSIRRTRDSSAKVTNTRAWRIATYAFASVFVVGALMFCAQFVALHPPIFWSAIAALLVGFVGLAVIAVRSLWLRAFHPQ